MNRFDHIKPILRGICPCPRYALNCLIICSVSIVTCVSISMDPFCRDKLKLTVLCAAFLAPQKSTLLTEHTALSPCNQFKQIIILPPIQHTEVAM